MNIRAFPWCFLCARHWTIKPNRAFSHSFIWHFCAIWKGTRPQDTSCPLPMKKNVIYHISKQRMLHPSATTATPNGAHRGDLGWRKADTGPRELRCISKEWFQWAQTLPLQIHRKVLNSLTYYIWFSLINSNLLMFQLPGLCCKTPIYPGPSLTPLEQSLRTIWEVVPQA